MRLQFDVSSEHCAFRRRNLRFLSGRICRRGRLLCQGGAAGNKRARIDEESNDARRQQQPGPAPGGTTSWHVTSLTFNQQWAFMTAQPKTSCCSRGSPLSTPTPNVSANEAHPTTPGRRLARRCDRRESAATSCSACFCRESTGVNFPSPASIPVAIGTIPGKCGKISDEYDA